MFSINEQNLCSEISQPKTFVINFPKYLLPNICGPAKT